MSGETELSRNILMHYHNIHGTTWGREVRIHKKTTYLARKRVVVHSVRHTRQRFLPILPLKHTENKEYLRIPEGIITEDQLWAYVAKEKPCWLDCHSRRHRDRG